MSLINARNFIAPLQNKVQVGTLLVFALIIAFVRMISEGTPAEPRESLKVNDSIKAFLKSQEPKTVVKDNAAQEYAVEPEVSFDELTSPRKEVKRAPPQQPSEGSHSGLLDVRRMVGLE